ncbi:Hypothetical protein NTJ_10022 [Nesidiocoris tenuis]|uniref:Uncharacterized protein n=1 Tax=Nesidiocoris tenuis TaxID=355587 RepID=A0ABN7AYY5_9HEMI|nr:Hypothetical protein NTJ_10022 [Nesidiocoris tenuis]
MSGGDVGSERNTKRDAIATRGRELQYSVILFFFTFDENIQSYRMFPDLRENRTSASQSRKTSNRIPVFRKSSDP